MMTSTISTRVALISFDFAEYNVRLANGLNQHADVLLLLPERRVKPFIALLDPRVQLMTFQMPRLRQPRRQLRLAHALLKAIGHFRPTVVHMQHRHLWLTPLLATWTRARRLPLVVTVHDAVHHTGDRDGQRTPQAINELGWRAASRLIVHGDHIKQQVVERIGRADEIAVMPHIAIGATAEVEPTDENVVLFFGRIWPYKGLDVLIQAQPLINAAVPNARIIIAGTGEPFDRYQALIEQPEAFEIHNRYVSDAERAELFARASLLALPYVEASQSGVIPVASRAARPVVASRIGSLPEAIDDNVTGILVEPNDVQALADAIINLLQNKAQCRAMGRNAQQKIMRDAGAEIIGQQTLAVYLSASVQTPRWGVSPPPSQTPVKTPRWGVSTPIVLEMITKKPTLWDGAIQLHAHMTARYWTGSALIGPDPGTRWNARIGRFLKSYTRFLPWDDDRTYYQAQGYWILNNWMLYDRTGDDRYRRMALRGTEFVRDTQQPAGHWVYPNPEWAGRIATVEGCFGAIGLIETYRRTGDDSFHAAADRWVHYVETQIGYEEQAGGVAVHYFANHPGALVPNNATLVLQLLARMANATNEASYLDRAPGLVRWLTHAQEKSGEMPYALDGLHATGRPHLWCYQYNAFEFIDMAHYYELTGDETIWPVLQKLAGYLATGIRPNGAACHDCTKELPEVNYYSMAVATALSMANRMGLTPHRDLADLGLRHALGSQRPDGSFPFYSRRNYGIFNDRRGYPRYLAMVLHHMLLELDGIDAKETAQLGALIPTPLEVMA